MDPYIRLSVSDLALASVLLLVQAGLSLALDLGLHRRMVIAALRMMAQLALMGLVLEQLFSLRSPWLTGTAVLVMCGFAGSEITSRQDRPLRGVWAYGLGTGAMLLAAVLVTVLALTTAVRPDPWYDPRYAIPLLGMILGNTMSGISLGMNSLSQAVTTQRSGIEAMLCLGYSRAQAFRPLLRQALRVALTPIVNAMAATGVVSLPGMMTGQILGGVPPAEAVKYQILIMFLIAGGTGLGALAALTGGVWRLSDDRHRLRLDHLRPAKGRK